MELQDIKSMTLAEIQESIKKYKHPKIPAFQVYKKHQHGLEKFE